MGRSGLLIFESTSVALATERLLQDAGIPVTVIPTPVEISAGCGIALMLREDRVEMARRALEGKEGHRLLYPYDRG